MINRYGWVGFLNVRGFCSPFVIAEICFRVYSAVYTIIYDILEYDK